MNQNGFLFNGARCTGCKTCELACKDYKDLSKDVAYRKVYDYEGGTWAPAGDGTYTTSAFIYHMSIACNHCENPACAHVCPTGAMHKESDTGLVLVDATKCIGCGYCHMACPYNAPKVDREKGHSVKCDGCKSRVTQGKRPICVEACPLRALDFGSVERLNRQMPDFKQAAIAPLPDPSYTDPNLFIKAAPSAKPVGDTAGRITNILEVQ